MEMVLKCVLKSMEDANRHIDAMGRAMKKTQSTSRRALALGMIGVGLAVYAYIRERELEERIGALEETIEEITTETDESEDEMEE